jgi:NAD(P)H-dependent FMN reductase
MRALILNGALAPDPFLDSLTARLTADFVARKFAVETVVLRDVAVAYCHGCFECWTHSPGICKIDDAGRDLSRDFTVSDVVVLVTPVRFGSYSSETKKMLDRTLGTLLPFFRKIDGEVHHVPRYAYPPALGVVAVQDGVDAQSETTVRVLGMRNAINFASPSNAVAVVNRRATAGTAMAELDALVSSLTGLRGKAEIHHIANVDDLLPVMPLAPDGARPTRALLLVGSAKPRGSSTSESLGQLLMEQLALRGVEGEIRHVSREAHSDETLRAFVADVRRHDLLVIASPIYIDALPALVTRTLEAIADDRIGDADAPPLTVAMVLNCGFPESRHAAVARTIGALFSRAVGARWAGALQLGGGGVIHGRPLPEVGHIAQHLLPLLDETAEALSRGQSIPPETRQEFKEPLMPTALYMAAGDAAWLWTATHEGALTRLWERPAVSTV